jgi:type VI protein secretion system component VasK
MEPSTALITVLVVLSVVALVFTVWAIVDVLRVPEPRSAGKLVWVILILATNLLGALLYLWLGRPRAAAPLSAR